jgi:hypothetical protein
MYSCVFDPVYVGFSRRRSTSSAVRCCASAIIECIHDGVYGLTCRSASVDDKGDCAYLVDGIHRQRGTGLSEAVESINRTDIR